MYLELSSFQAFRQYCEYHFYYEDANLCQQQKERLRSFLLPFPRFFFILQHKNAAAFT